VVGLSEPWAAMRGVIIGQAESYMPDVPAATSRQPAALASRAPDARRAAGAARRKCDANVSPRFYDRSVSPCWYDISVSPCWYDICVSPLI
jgi:hypothetical protein